MPTRPSTATSITGRDLRETGQTARSSVPKGVAEYAKTGIPTTLFRGRASAEICNMDSLGHAAGSPTAETEARPVPIVLIADDDEDILALVALRLRRSGLDVILARDGEEALELVQTHLPDAAVLDIAMPKLTGLEVTRLMREAEATKAIRIVLLTARAGEKDVELGLAAGADEYITKPFSPRDLYACIASLLSLA